MWPNLRRVLAQFGATIVAGLVAGAAAGLGARVAMLVARLMNDSHNGENTHASAIVGQVTVSGTVSVVVEGMFLGVAGALAYLLVRRWVPGRGAVKGVVFGLGLLVVGGSAGLDGNYEFFRYVHPWLAVAMFAALYPLFGAVLAFVCERWTKRPQGRPSNLVVAVAGWSVLGILLVRGTMASYGRLRDVYHLLPS